jgi:parallel beta-helix repeat protein
VQGIGTDYNFIMGNYIGSNVGGGVALPNLSNGIEIKAGNQNFVVGNTIAYNKGGITIKPGEHNRIHHNSLRENGKSSDSGNNNLWDDGHQGNYWSDYSGKDANGDGVGDNPYSVSPNGVDRYPLMKPYDGRPR